MAKQTKIERQLAAAKKAASNARAKSKNAGEDLTRKASMAGSAYLLGKGALDFIPRFGDRVPRTASMALIGNVGAMFVGGKAGAALEGFGDAGLCVAAFQYGSGEAVSGVESIGASDAELDALEAELDDLSSVAGYDDDFYEDDDDGGDVSGIDYDDDDDDDDDEVIIAETVEA